MKKNKMYNELKKIVNNRIDNTLYCYREFDSDYQYILDELDFIINKKLRTLNVEEFSISFRYGVKHNVEITLMTNDVIGHCVFTDDEWVMLVRKLKNIKHNFECAIRDIRKEKHLAYKQQSKSKKKNECRVVLSI